jgi:hypothetical protein
LLINLAAAQQGDILIGGSTLMTSDPNNDSVAFQPATQKGGTYVSVGGDFIKWRHRLGLSAEVAWRYKRADYPDIGETYRPFFTDANVFFQPRLRKNLGLDLFAGIGVASYRFSIPYATACGVTTSGCTFYTSSNHFMEDVGGGVRYYVWHRIPNVFVRPEVHYYHIHNNFEFHSDNVFRVGASIGYTIGR